MLKLWLGVIIGVFTAVAGWTLNKLNIDENILISLAGCVIVVLIVMFFVIVAKIDSAIKDIGDMKK